MNARINLVRILGLDAEDILAAHDRTTKNLDVVVSVNGCPLVSGRAELRFVDGGIEYAVAPKTEATEWLERTSGKIR